jgi:phage/plasmid primase-like uncharacterized protein
VKSETRTYIELINASGCFGAEKGGRRKLCFTPVQDRQTLKLWLLPVSGHRNDMWNQQTFMHI